LPEEAHGLKVEIRTWRETRTQVGPMPASLWKRAARLAAVYGACPIAKAIGVDYSALREHMGTQAAPAAEPTFLEIPAAMVLAGPQTEGGPAEVGWHPSETQVELSLADGSRLRMRGPALDAAAIVAAFVRRP
jgi:hypothetical protein